MANTLTVDRNDLKGFATAYARKEWLMAVMAWAMENTPTEFDTVIGLSDGSFEVRFDPSITEPDLSQFQTEMDTLKSVSGVPGSRVFTHL